MNTNQVDFPEEIKEIASSIKKEFAIEVQREEVIAEFCNLLEKKIEKRICVERKQKR